MPQWLRKLKGILGMGVVGSAFGALLGIVLVLTLLAIAPAGLTLRGNALIVGKITLLGGFFGATFATVLTLASGQRPLGSLSAGRSAALGAAAGALFIPIASAVIGYSLPLVPALIGIFATVGAAFGGALIAVAQNAPERELTASDSQRLREASPAESSAEE